MHRDEQGLFSPCSENKSADHMRLCLRICMQADFLMTQHMCICFNINSFHCPCRLLIAIAISLDPDQTLQNVGPHYENTPMQYTAIFHGCKNDNF